MRLEISCNLVQGSKYESKILVINCNLLLTTTFNPDLKELANLAAKKLSSIFTKYSNSSVLFLSSGGSCIEILNTDSTWKWPKDFTVSVLDERFTDNLKNRNFKALQKTKFFENIKDSAKLIDPIIPGLSFSEAGKQFNFEIKNWILDHPNGKIVITQGVGIEGHTAGIFPMKNKDDFENIFIKTDTLVNTVQYNNLEDRYQERITLNLKFLEFFVDNSILFVVGEQKVKILKKVIENKAELKKIPACIINKMRQVDLFSDIK